VPKMQEKVQQLSHLDLVISQIPTIVLQGLHINIAQEMWFCAESTLSELEKVTMKKMNLQQDYTTALHEKIVVDEKDERILKENSKAEERPKDH